MNKDQAPMTEEMTMEFRLCCKHPEAASRLSVQIKNQKFHPPVVGRVKIENFHFSNRRTDR